MGRILPGGGRPVVASETVVRYDAVIEASTGPANRTVTIRALIRTDHMVGRLARSRLPVVATGTIIPDAAVIHSSRLPETSGVTVAAGRLNWKVTGRGTRFGEAPAAAVTGITRRRGAFELTSLMTAFAGDVLMTPGEHEARQVVVESRLGSLRRSARRQQRTNDENTREVRDREFLSQISVSLEGDQRMRRTGHCLAPLERPRDAGFHALKVWQPLQLRPNPP